MKEEINRLTEFLKLAGKKMYGSSTERLSEDYDQLCLFEEEAEEQPVTVETNVNSHKRKKRCTLEEKLKIFLKQLLFTSLWMKKKSVRNAVKK